MTVMWMLIVTQRNVQSFRPIVRGFLRQSPWIIAIHSFASKTDESIAPERNAFTPWNRLPVQDSSNRRNNKRRFRQHVNPLARIFQTHTPLSLDWPRDIFHDVSKSLHLDIGCGKGGFLLDLATQVPGKNYLGVEIRPTVAEFAQSRVAKRDLVGTLHFVGCNANVDLDRLLTRYSAAGGGALDVVTIQFPDPHFKSHHIKRRVVNSSLVQTLAKFMPSDAVVFLQSDVQEVLDDMRSKFRDHHLYFEDMVKDVATYMPDNYIFIPTERETSVVNKNLPVFRTVFRRTNNAFQVSFDQ